MNFTRYSLSIIAAMLVLMYSGCYPYTRSKYDITIIKTTQRQTVITGRVVDRNDNIAIPGVQISSTDTLTSTTTDKDGYYKLKANGGHARFKLLILANFFNYSKALNLKEGDSVILNFKMKADNRPLEDVSID